MGDPRAETEAEHWGLDGPVGCLDPEQELESIELGERVAWHTTTWLLNSVISTEEGREQAATLTLVHQVAQGCRERQESVPDEWVPSALSGREERSDD